MVPRVGGDTGILLRATPLRAAGKQHRKHRAAPRGGSPESRFSPGARQAGGRNAFGRGRVHGRAHACAREPAGEGGEKVSPPSLASFPTPARRGPSVQARRRALGAKPCPVPGTVRAAAGKRPSFGRCLVVPARRTENWELAKTELAW